MKLPQPDYKFKGQAEGAWAAVGIVVAYAVGRIFDVPPEVSASAGILARPVFGYVLSLLPRKEGADG